MTPRENLLKVLHHQEPEWIPYTPLVDDYGIPTFIPEELQKRRNTVDIVRFLGGDIMDRHVSLLETSYTNMEITEVEKNGVLSRKVETPIGILQEEKRTVNFAFGNTTYVTEFMIKSVEDYPAFRYYWENTSYWLDEENFQERVRYIGNDGLATPNGPSTPIMDLIRFFMGGERFIYHLQDYPLKVKELLEVMREKYLQAYRLLAQSSAEVIISYDDADSFLITPGMFRDFVVPVLRQCADICHSVEKLFIFHACGHVKDFLSMVKDIEIDGFDCLCPPPTGDTFIWEARKIWGKGIVILGVVEPTVLREGPPSRVAQYVREVLEEVAPGDNFILVSGTTPDVKKENFQVIGEVMKKLGKYPFSL